MHNKIFQFLLSVLITLVLLILEEIVIVMMYVINKDLEIVVLNVGHKRS